MMKNKLIPLLGGIAVFALLVGIYAVKSNSRSPLQNAEETTEDTSDTISYVNSGRYTLCDKNAEDVRSIDITSHEAGKSDSELSLVIGEDGSYSVKNYEDVVINPSNAASLASNFVSLYADEVIEQGDRAVYGLAEPLAEGKATYSDGSTLTLRLGSLTADKKYYYVESSDAEGIYLVDAVVGKRLLYGINDLVDKNISAIKANYVDYIQVIKADGDELLIYYDAEKSNANTVYANSGLATLTMEKPVNGASVYPYNLTGSILRTCSGLTVSSVVDAKPEDYSVYGLDKPRVTVRLRDNENKLEIKAGSDAGDENVYALIDGRVSVFAINKSLLEPFENYNVTDFIEKFIALHMRTDISSAELTGESGSFKLDFKSENGKELVTDNKGNIKDNRDITINGSAVKADGFAAFYELLAGLTFDQITEHTQKSGQPDAVLVYTMLDGSKETINFYDYNSNFYIIDKDGSYDLLISKQSVKQVADRALALTE